MTGPPSAPQNLVYNINQTTVSLEWSPPADNGGRNDVSYRVLCRRCGSEPEECVPCGPNVGYSPAQAGLADTYVSVVDLLAHANYTFEVEAVNGVSDLSRTQRLFAAVSVATGQSGKDPRGNSVIRYLDLDLNLLRVFKGRNRIFIPFRWKWFSSKQFV